MIFSDERSDKFPDIPTAKELGVDFSSTEPRLLIAPANLPDDVEAKLVGILEGIGADAKFQADLTEQVFLTEWISAEEVTTMLDKSADELGKLKTLSENIAK